MILRVIVNRHWMAVCFGISSVTLEIENIGHNSPPHKRLTEVVDMSGLYSVNQERVQLILENITSNGKSALWVSRYSFI